jgi:hypothetical protein
MESVGPLVLTRQQASLALAVSANAFAEIVAELPWIELDGREVVSITALEAWIARRSRGDEIRTKA